MNKQLPLGLYQSKYWLRNHLRRLPNLQQLNPNTLSLLAFIPGLLAALCLYTEQWAGAILSIAARMFLNTLDGLIAEEFQKTSRLGAYLNRLPGECTDLLLIAALYPQTSPPWLLALLLSTSWVQITSILPLVAQAQTQSIGPCGQTDRLAWLILCCGIALTGHNPWPIAIPALTAGCLLTISLRVYRTLTELKAAPKNETTP
jgi:CDP-diacylglycerol---glycerol-3-phosphate 3-phosphatidyltransferase